ncbi:MAG: chemotaxis protein CheA [Sphingomonadaceae bacterium]
MLSFDAAPDELQLFLQEAEEQLQLLDQDIVLLEKEGPRPELLQEIFRAAHTLKGSSASIGHRKMASLTHAMENVLDQLRQGRAGCTTELVDVLLESLDALRLFKEEVVTLQDCGFDPADLVESLNVIVSVAAESPEGGTGVASSPSDSNGSRGKGGDAVAVSVKIDEECLLASARCLQCYLEAGRFGTVLECSPSLEAIENQQGGHRLEMVVAADADLEGMVAALKAIPDIADVTTSAAKPADSSASSEGGVTRGTGGPATSSGVSREPGSVSKSSGSRSGGLGKTVRIDVTRLDDLLNLVGELVIDRTRLIQIGLELQAKYDDLSIGDLSETSQHIGRIVDELQESIMKARMLPVEALFNRLPRVVRDLAQRSGKKVDFVVEGRETELDRSVIEELHDPLVHLLRNCVDHGVETPEQRVAAGKPEVGRIALSAMHRENRILLKVEDDGAGIDPDKVKAKAIEKGLLTPEAAKRLSESEAIDLIFSPGFSTAATVTDVSGRGVGMDIVRTNIEKLNGAVHVQSKVGEGTRFTLELPLTLAIIDALMVGLGDEVLAIPLVSVVETLRVRRNDIHWINKRQAIQLRGSVLPLIGLDHALGLPSSNNDPDRVFVVAVRVGDNRYGLVVDSLLGELQVVIKSLGRQVGNIAGVTGATILGDGRVALIIDVPSLVKSVLDEQSKGCAA